MRVAGPIIYLVAIALAFVLRHYWGASAPAQAGNAVATACECEVRTVVYGSAGTPEALEEHIRRNIPLRIVGVPPSVQPDLRDSVLREASGHRHVRLRALGTHGEVKKFASETNATLQEALRDGGRLARTHYAAQISVPNNLPELLPTSSAPGSRLGSVWASGAGPSLAASPYLYYFGGAAGGGAKEPDATHSKHSQVQGREKDDGPALYMHYDAAENLLQVTDGWKEFWLYDPFQAAQLLYGSNVEHGNASPINPESPDIMEKYPIFRFALPRKCVVRANEWLYVPLFWWHRVRSGDDRTVSLVHFHEGDKDKKGFFQKIMCGYSLKPAAFECGKFKGRPPQD